MIINLMLSYVDDKMYDLRIGMIKAWEALFLKFVALSLCFLALSYYKQPENLKEVHLLEVSDRHLFLHFFFDF